MDSRPAFFKVIRSREHLKIPPAFVLEMDSALPNPVILRDCDKNLWLMEVSRIGDDWCFSKGWSRFYKENSVEMDDLITFEYKGHGLFDFRLLGGNGCDKKGVGDLKFRVKEEGHDEDQAEEEGDYRDSKIKQEEQGEDLAMEEEDQAKAGVVEEYEVKEAEQDEDQSEEEEHNDEDEDCMQEEGEDEDQSQEEDYTDEDEDSMQMEDHGEEEEQAKTSKKTETFGVETLPARRRYEKNNPDCYGADIFKSGLARRPRNPFFVSRSRPRGRMNDLHIPRDVIVDYRLRIPKNLYLADERGRQWETEIKQWADGRLWCTGGWGRLCNANQIADDDACICEFVQESGKDLYILVRVVGSASSSL